MTVFLASWAIVCGALLLAGVSLGGVRPALSLADGVALAALVGWAVVLFVPVGRWRFEIGAGLAGVAAVAEVLGWPVGWPPEAGKAPLVVLAGLHLVFVVAGGMAVAARRRSPGRRLVRWYAVAAGVVWIALLIAGRA